MEASFHEAAYSKFLGSDATLLYPIRSFWLAFKRSDIDRKRQESQSFVPWFRPSKLKSYSLFCTNSKLPSSLTCLSKQFSFSMSAIQKAPRNICRWKSHFENSTEERHGSLALKMSDIYPPFTALLLIKKTFCALPTFWARNGAQMLFYLWRQRDEIRDVGLFLLHNFTAHATFLSALSESRSGSRQAKRAPRAIIFRVVRDNKLSFISHSALELQILWGKPFFRVDVTGADG